MWQGKHGGGQLAGRPAGRQQTVKKISDEFNLIHLEVINESHMHSGPNTESHFKVILVSDEFEDVKLVQRHRRINELLKFELENGVHALSLHLFTNNEWKDKEEYVKDSPPCAK